MAITDFTAYKAGVASPIRIPKQRDLTSQPPSAPFNSSWKTAPDNPGNPAAADCNLNGASSGALFSAIAASGTARLAQIEAAWPASGSVILCDRIAHMGGLSGTVTSAQFAGVATCDVELAGSYAFAGTAQAAHVLTLTRPIPVGHSLLLSITGGFTSAVSVLVSDSRSNTWDLTNEEYQTTSSNLPFMVNLRPTIALQIGDTVTVTFKSAANGTGTDVTETRVSIIAAHITGANATGVLKDQVSGAAATDANPHPPITGTPTQAATVQFSSVRVAMASGESALDIITSPPANYTLLFKHNVYTGTSGVTQGLAYRIQTTAITPGVSDTWTLTDATHAWRTMQYGLKAAPATSRIGDPSKLMMAIEVYTQIGATGTTITASYSNQAGTSGRTSTAVAVGANGNREVGRFIQLPLQATDTGLKSVENVTLAATTGTAGSFGVTIYRPLAMFQTGLRGQTTLWDGMIGGCGNLPDVTNICPFFLYYYTLAPTGSPSFELRCLDT